VIAAPGLIRRQPEQLTPRYWQLSLPGEVSDLASRPAVIAAVGKAGEGAVARIRLAFARYARERA